LNDMIVVIDVVVVEIEGGVAKHLLNFIGQRNGAGLSFFFVQPYSHSAYVDYGGALFKPSAVPARYVKHPRAGSVAAPSPPTPG